MLQFTLTDFLSPTTKQWLFDQLIDVSSQIAQKLLGDEIALKLGKLRSDAAFNDAFQKALKRASERWVAEYYDKEIVENLTKDKELWKNNELIKLLGEIVRTPGGYHEPQFKSLLSSLQLQSGISSNQLEEAISYLLKCLSDEVISIPQLQPIYQLQFQRINTEIARKQLAEIENFRSELRDTISLISAHSFKQLGASQDFEETKQAKIFHNLPMPERRRLLGRDNEIELLKQHLKPYPESWLGVITIDGVGGVGKSALALEVAYQFAQNYETLAPNDRFDAIIWTSAKNFIPTASGILRRSNYSRNLSDIFTTISTTLQRVDIIKEVGEAQINLVRNAISSQRTLLIIDNLETIDDEFVISFIRELPPPTKVIVTTRHRLDVAYPIRLVGMSQSDAIELAKEEQELKNIELSSEQLQQIAVYTGGIPLAVVLTIGRISLGYEIDSALEWLSHPKGDIAKYCFEESVGRIRKTPAYKVLLSVGALPSKVNRYAIGEISGMTVNKKTRDDSLAELVQLSLLNKDGDNFSMLPLTRKYTLSKINKKLEHELLTKAGYYFLNTFSYAIKLPRWKSYDFIEGERENILYIFDYLFSATDNTSNHKEVSVLLTGLGEVLAPYFLARGYWNDYRRVCLQCVDHARKIDRYDLIVRFSHYLSRYYWHIKDLEQANLWAKTGYEEGVKYGDEDILAIAQHMLGILAIGDGKLYEAKILLESALKHRTELYGCMGVCAIKEDLGFALMEMNQLDAAEALLQESLEQQKESDDQEGQSIDLYYLGLVAEKKARKKDAIDLFYKSMLLAETVNRSTTTANCQLALARLLDETGNIAEAKNMAQLAHKSYEKLGMTAQQMAADQIIARI